MKKILKRCSLIIFTLLLCCFTKDVYAVRIENVCQSYPSNVEVLGPQCVQIPVTVDIFLEGFEEFLDIEILSDDTLEEVDFPAPTKDGYIFNGWHYKGQIVSNSRDLRLMPLVGTRQLVVHHPVTTPSGVEMIEEYYYTESYKSGYRDTTFILEPIFLLAEKKVILNNSTGSNETFSSLDSGEKVSVQQVGNYIYGGVYYDSAYTNKVNSLDWNNLNFISQYNGEYNGEDGLFSGYENLNLYVKWNEAIYNLSYETNGGQALASETVNLTKKNWTNLKTPTKEGYNFKGWFYDSNLTQKVDGNSTENINAQATYNNNLITGYTPVKLYAKWEKIEDVTNPQEPNKPDSEPDKTDNEPDKSDNEPDKTDNEPDKTDNNGNSSNIGSNQNDGNNSNLHNQSADEQIKNPNTGVFAYGLIISLLLMMIVICFVRKKCNLKKIFKI